MFIGLRYTLELWVRGHFFISCSMLEASACIPTLRRRSGCRVWRLVNTVHNILLLLEHAHLNYNNTLLNSRNVVVVVVVVFLQYLASGLLLYFCYVAITEEEIK